MKTMKKLFLLLPLTLSLLLAGCAARQTVTLQTPTVVEAACGECKFRMEGKDCELAIRIDGRSYFVDGVNEKSLGDPHAADGICNAIRQARVTGEVRRGRFAASSFELLPATEH